MNRIALSTLILVIAAPCAADLCATVDVHRIGWNALERLKNAESVAWSVENGADLVLCGSEAVLELAAREERLVRHVEYEVAFERAFLVRGEIDFEDLEGVERVLTRRRRFAVVELGPGVPELPWPYMDKTARHVVLVAEVDNRPAGPEVAFSRSVQDLVDLVDENRWFSNLASLAAFNRYSYNETIFDAESWLVAQFSALPNLVVTTSGPYMGGRQVHNVFATLTGAARPDDWVIVGGHYDSTSENTAVAAPGAEDNASGCAGVLEMATIFSTASPEATMIFVCYVGEEQWFEGSFHHVADLIANSNLDKVQVMLNMDMIGYTEDADLDVLLESLEFGQSVIDTFAAAAAQYSSLRVLTTWNAYGSDHMPYLWEGVPAILTIENDEGSYPDYHKTTDLPANITPVMGREILKMNVAAAAHYAGAGPDLVFGDGFESGGTGAWSGVTNDPR